MKIRKLAGLSIVLALGLSILPGQALASDAAVKKLLKRNDCTKCHAVNKTKKGPSYQKIAEELKAKPLAEAEQIVIDNLTKAPKVKLEDGTEEEHKIIEGKDPKEIKAIFDWIMSL